MTMENVSADNKEFLAQCEEELKDRYTENDKDFMAVHNAEPVDPPILENWWVSQNYGCRGRGGKRRFDHSNRNSNRNYGDRGYHNRGYHDRSYEERGSQNRGYGSYSERRRH